MGNEVLEHGKLLSEHEKSLFCRQRSEPNFLLDFGSQFIA
jgi:hypothetical protein